MEQKIIPTWGYKSNGSAQIFDLKEGEGLPDGWSYQPELWNHPNTAHLYSRPAELEYDIVRDEMRPKKRRGRPPNAPKSQDDPSTSAQDDEEPGAELASELRDE